MTSDNYPAFQWDVEMPLLTSRFFLYDMGKVVFWTGLIVNLLLSVIFLAEGHLRGLQTVMGYMALILAGMLLLFLLIALVFFGNRYPCSFSVSAAGIGWESASGRAGAANRAAVVLGALAGSPGAAGAGLLAISGESRLDGWNEVRRVKKYPDERVITVMNGWRVTNRLYCTPENYAYVAQLVDWYMAMARARTRH
jgi:hypothetical protein